MFKQQFANLLRYEPVDLGRPERIIPTLTWTRDRGEIVNLVRHDAGNQSIKEIAVGRIADMPMHAIQMRIRMKGPARLPMHNTFLLTQQVNEIIAVLAGGPGN